MALARMPVEEARRLKTTLPPLSGKRTPALPAETPISASDKNP
jgi:hypothetical protein